MAEKVQCIYCKRHYEHDIGPLCDCARDVQDVKQEMERQRQEEEGAEWDFEWFKHKYYRRKRIK